MECPLDPDKCLSSVDFTRTSLKQILNQDSGISVSFKMASESPVDQYCQWEFELDPNEKYLIFIKRERPASELIELEIEGLYERYEFI